MRTEDLEATVAAIKKTAAVKIEAGKASIDDREQIRLNGKVRHAKQNGRGGCRFGHPLLKPKTLPFWAFRRVAN